MTARPLFVGGTSSNAGKSWMVTAICAWLHRRGVSVAPFKAQNMSNHSYPCRGGGEIGRAQVAQAEACGLEAQPAMNPILLKPNGAGSSQVVVNGRVWKTMTAREYYAAAQDLRSTVLDAYADLASRHDVIVMEGAGSVSELNLRDHDLLNLGLVTAIRAPWILVADIERGGVFGSVVGTVNLLTPDERALFRGFAINKFRGDRSLFDDGVRILEAQTGSTCLGVFPHIDDIHLDAEDSLSVHTVAREPAPAGARTAIIRFPLMSNATDFRLLRWADWISVPPADTYDFVILPGSKNTIADLEWLRRTGLAEWVLAQRRGGATVIGICGGYQMLGLSVSDPNVMEQGGSIEGLGLVPVHTTLTRDKRTRVVSARTNGGVEFSGYEIHLGRTTPVHGEALSAFAALADGSHDGVRAPGVIGTYLHGALEDPVVFSEIFGHAPAESTSRTIEYERLADWFEQNARNLAVVDSLMA
jgi:adenosylcobyric acid synthase